MIRKQIARLGMFVFLSGVNAAVWSAGSPPSAPQSSREFGPYHGYFIPGGQGLRKQLNSQIAPLGASAPWSLYCWMRSEGPLPPRTLLGGFGAPDAEAGAKRYLAVWDGRLSFWAGDEIVSATGLLDSGNWTMIAATYDGAMIRLYRDGEEVASKALQLRNAAPVMYMAPHIPSESAREHFSGRIAQFTLAGRALAIDQLQALSPQIHPLDLLPFEAGSKPWPVSTSATVGLRAQQDPSTLPKSAVPGPLRNPAANQTKKPAPQFQAAGLIPRNAHQWIVSGGWSLAELPQITAGGAEISRAGFSSGSWLPATVPGTVLTTLIDQGVYPDPDFGLHNLLIPESLNRQDYWYRAEFAPPAALKNRRLTLTFEGINYAAEVWLNGKRLGSITGAFIRGHFDVTAIMAPGKANALAVRVSPPPHPGIPHEQSMRAGAGLNGGMLCLDGPTFLCTEGWDWLPGIRDRNTGIWQDVVLTATGAVKIGDLQVVTALPLPDTGRGDVTLTVPLRNESQATVSGVLTASFEGVKVEKKMTLRPGENEVAFAPRDFPQLAISKPRLWWPNGYGKPELYHLHVAFHGTDGESDSRDLRFGIREITYELTLMDKAGRLRRVEYRPTAAKGIPVVDVRYEAALESAAGYVYSMRPGVEPSPGLRALDDLRTSPNLVVRVNGARIACKGGNWGLDDARKRVSRARLEPYVRLHRDANLTMIRNWCGQST